MPQYFMRNTPLAGLERQMMEPPNFLPRGGGTARTRFHYRKKDVDCKYCMEYRGRKCTAGICPHIPERLEAGAVGYRELVHACFYGLPHPALLLRIRTLAQRRPVFAFKDAAHCRRMRGCLHGDMAQAGHLTMAAVYLLTSDETLWAAAAPAIQSREIDYLKVRLSFLTPQQTALYQAVRGFSAGTILLTPDLLADSRQADDDTLRLIVNAALIARYGTAVILAGEPEDCV